MCEFIENLKRECARLKGDKPDNSVSVNSEKGAQLLYVLEQILFVDVKRGGRGFFGSVFGGASEDECVWKWFRNLEKCLPDTSISVKRAEMAAETPIGRIRAFLRDSLNEKTLHDSLRALCWDKSAVESVFGIKAILRDDDMVEELVEAVKDLELSGISFALWVTDPDLDSTNYWDSKDIIA